MNNKNNKPQDDIRAINREAWNHAVEDGSEWTKPVNPEEIARAKAGDWQVVLTASKKVPRAWFGNIQGKDVLCLASGGGQQAPIFAAAGANVTSFDNSPRQLEQDQKVAEREGLTIHTIEGDMRDLSVLADASFDIVFNPVSNCFVPDVIPIWQESARVLRTGGNLLAGFNNPTVYIFDEFAAEKGKMIIKNPLPYSDLLHLSTERKESYKDTKRAFEFSHTLDELIAGQLEAGLILTGFYEDYWHTEEIYHPWNKYFPSFFATCAKNI